VRGRAVRLGAAVDEVLTRHDYPEPVANLLGEACALAALVGSSLKFEGRLIVQAQGDGPVRYVVVDYDTMGACAATAGSTPTRWPRSRRASCARARDPAGRRHLHDDGRPGPDMDRYQGITPIEGETLALCAEQYFAQSEQTPTRVRLAVGQVDTGEGPTWRAGGILIQAIAGDETRGETEEAWNHVRALFETTGEDELIDPTVPTTDPAVAAVPRGWRAPAREKPLRAFCRCSEDRIGAVLGSFTAEEVAEMVEPDGKIHVTCEYCSRVYKLDAPTA
jgi:molecular chaperone Hsp33